MKKYMLCVALLAVSLVATADNEKADAAQRLQEYELTRGQQRVDRANSLMQEYEELADTLYQFDRKTERRYMDGMVYYWTAYSQWTQGDNTGAVQTNEQAIRLLEQTDSTVTLADCLALSTIIYTRLSDFATAASYAERTLELDRATGDKANISTTLNTIAAIWSGANEPATAKRYITEAIEIERALDRPAVLAIRLGLGSEILLKGGENEAALQMAREALKIEPIAERKGVRKSQLGAVLAGMKRYAEAEKILTEARDELQEAGNITSLGITLSQLAHIALQQGRHAEAIKHLQPALDIAERTGNLLQESKVRKMMAEALVQSDPALAMQHMERYAALNDSIFNTRAAQQLQLSNVKYETTKKEQQLELQRQQMSRQRILIALCVLVTLVVVVVALLMGRLARTRGRANAILTKALLAKDELLEVARQDQMQGEATRQRILEVADSMSALGELPEVNLTRREMQLVRLFAQGKISKEIADELGISVRTVETHKTHIYKKIGINNSVELLRFAQLKGLV